MIQQFALPITAGLKSQSWKKRRDTYDRILYFLQSGSREMSFSGEILTIEKLIPMLNLLSEEQNVNVSLQGMECLKLVIHHPAFRVSTINHYLSEGFEKYCTPGKLLVEFEGIISGLTVKSCGYVVGLIISKFENKNPKVVQLCLQILQTPGTMERVLRNKEASNQLYTAIQSLCCSQTRQIKLAAVDINNMLETALKKDLIERPMKQHKQTLQSVCHDVVKSFEQSTHQRKIESARQLRQIIENLTCDKKLLIEPYDDHFQLLYTIRLMIEDSNQLLWAEGVRLLSLLIPLGLKIKDVGYIVDKLRVGKHPANQIVFHMFDQFVLNNSKRADEYMTMLQELFQTSNRENIKIAALQLVARIAYLTNRLESNEQACSDIQEKIFNGMTLFADLPQQYSQVYDQTKNRLITSYNKIGLKWLLRYQHTARYKELIEQILYSMKQFHDRSLLIEEKEKETKKPTPSTSGKCQGMAKVFNQILTCMFAPKQLDKKIAVALDFIKKNQDKYAHPFYLMELLSHLTIRLHSAKLTNAQGEKLSNFVITILKHFIKQYPKADIDSVGLFIDMIFSRLQFKHHQQTLMEMLNDMVNHSQLLEQLLRKLKNGVRLKRSNLRIMSKWLIDCQTLMSGYNSYYQLLDDISDFLTFGKEREMEQCVSGAEKDTHLPSPLKHQNEYIRKQETYGPYTREIIDVSQIERKGRSSVSSLQSGHREIQIPSVSEDEIGIDTHHSIEDIYTDPRDNSPPSYEFEQIDADLNEDTHGLHVEQLKLALSQNKNCFFFLKNEIYLRLKNVPDLKDKQYILRQLMDVVEVSAMSDISYDNILNILFLLFIEGKKHSELAADLQQVYEILRLRRTVPEFFVGLLKNVRPILQSINQPQDSEFLANVIAKSIERLSPHIQRADYLSLMCDINKFFQLGEVVYVYDVLIQFDLYKRQYDIITRMIFRVCDRWLSNTTQTETATIMDTFDTLCDNSFKRHIVEAISLGHSYV